MQWSGGYFLHRFVNALYVATDLVTALRELHEKYISIGARMIITTCPSPRFMLER